MRWWPLLLLLGVAQAQPATLADRKALLSHDLPFRAADDGRQKPDEPGVYDLISVQIQLGFEGPQLPRAARFVVRMIPSEALQVVPLLAASYVPTRVTQNEREIEFDFSPDSFEVLLFPDEALTPGLPVDFEIDAELTLRCNGDTACATDGTLFHLIDLGWYPLSYDAPVSDRFELLIQGTAAPPYVLAATGARDGPDWLGRWFYRTTVPTIAAALSVGPYDLVEGDIVELFVPPDNVDGGVFMGEVATGALRFYDQLYGAYPFPRLGISAIPDRAGAAIGPQANVLIPQGLWLVPENAGEAAEITARVLSHEIGHQYFFNLLAVLDEGEAWLSESWAEYSAVRFSRARTNTDAHRRENYWGYLLAVPDRGAALFGEAVRGHPNYFEIVYLKGSVVIGMLGERVGPNRFDDLLNDYVATFSGQIVTTEELQDFLSERVGRDVINPFFDEWIFNPGHPTITLSARPARNDNAPVEITARQDANFTGPLPLVLRLENGDEVTEPLNLAAGALRSQVAHVQGIWVDPELTLLRRVRAEPAGDVNISGVVDGLDLLDVWAHQGAEPPDRNFRDPLDVNRDEQIDQRDVRSVIDAFGQGW